MRKLLYTALVCLLLVVFGAGTWTGIWINRHNTDAVIVSKTSASEFQLVGQAWNITEDNYVDTNATQPQRLAYGTIEGMINSLGDTGHSTFLTPAEVKQANDFEQGQFVGVGLEVQEKNGNVVVVAPIEGFTGSESGNALRRYYSESGRATRQRRR